MTNDSEPVTSSTVAKNSDYDVEISVIMPGQKKPSAYHIRVRAGSTIDAHAKAEFEWNRIVSRFDVSVKKLQSDDKVVTAS